MTIIANAGLSRHGKTLPENTLPLFAWAASASPHKSPSTALPLPAAKLCQRFGLSHNSATLVANLAGFKAMENSHD